MIRLTAKLSFIFTLMLILIGSIGLLTQTVTLNRFAGLINSQLTTLTAQPVKLSGDIKLRLLPKPSLYVPLIEIGSSEAQSPYFAKLENSLFRLSISQLLQGKIRFNELKIAGFYIQFHLPFTSTQPLNPMVKPPLTTALLFQIKRLILGQGSVSIFHPQYTLNFDQLQLTAEQLNLNHQPFSLQLKSHVNYLPVASRPHASANFNFKGTTAIAPADLRDVAQLIQHLQINGDLGATEISYDKFLVDTLFTTIQTRASTLLLNPFRFNLYGGELFGDISIDTQIGQMFINQTGSNLRAGPILKPFFAHVPVSGNLDFSIHAALKYLQATPLKTLSGNGNLTIKEGVIYAFNLDVLLNYAKRFIRHLLNESSTSSPPPSPPPHALIFQQQTPFKILSLDYHLNNTKIVSNQVVFQSSKLEVDGAGNYDMNTQYIQGDFTAQLEDTDEQVRKVQQLVGGNFPFKVSGWVHRPHVEPDMPKLSPHIQALVVDKIMLNPLHDIQRQFNTFFQFNE
ncbi:MAG: AsmA family protein [Gammaproteobacteria bacterium]|nr:AsmA family protein [Gammaproteobacteria bacterium]